MPKKGPKIKPANSRKARVQADNAAMEAQRARIEELAAGGESLTKDLTKFDELPLSEPTKQGLKASHFTDLTEIQRECIVPALAKQDILAAARTGSGKTLGFLVPLLDRLYLEKWTQLDGLGALVITPTRELALQIFEVLRKVGRKHTFSAGLLIGGKNVQAEKERVGRLNILVATPGRLLQHMDESPSFDSNNLQMLVLDEADRIMDLGFKRTVDAIIQNLPPQRQTLLFSATQTKNVSDLARLSLSKPRYIAANTADTNNATTSETVPTPKSLEQFFTVTPLQDKLDVLWSFLRTHTKDKILVFFASSKQVRFVYESFRRMQPGIPLTHLHGRQKQTSRTETTMKFMRARSACLLATDVVARGLDFPEIDWVIQVDCPEDAATYIHRVGRSARAGKSGKALLMLTPSERDAFVTNLHARRIPITEINVNSAKKSSIQPELQAQLFQDPELKYLAQKAFISYVRSVYVQRDKTVFQVEKIPLEEFAHSLGLASAPNVKIRGSASATKELKNLPRALVKPSDSEAKKEVRTKYDRIFQRQNQNVLSEHYQKLASAGDDDDDNNNDNNSNDNEEDGFMTVKRRNHDLDDHPNHQHQHDDDSSDGDEHSDYNSDGDRSDDGGADGPTSKRALKRALSKKQSKLLSGKTSTKLVFDDEGQAHPLYEFDTEADFQKQGLPEEQRQQFVAGEREEMEKRDLTDKEVLKARRQEKKRRRKELERLAREGKLDGESGDDGEAVVRLPSDSESDSESEPEVEAAPMPKRRKQQQQQQQRPSEVLEVEEPESLADLEALSKKLLGH